MILSVFNVISLTWWVLDFFVQNSNIYHYLVHTHMYKIRKKYIVLLNTVWMLKLDLEKAEEPEIKLPTSVGSSKKRVLEKHLLLLY